MGAKKKAAQGSIDATNRSGTPAGTASGSSSYASLTFNDVLEDLSSRFIVNLPAEEQDSIQRICFQVEQAHWFYEDFLRPLNPSLPSFALRRFSSYLLHTAALTVPLIQRYISNSSNHESQQGLEAAFDEFLKYKTRVPVCGAVMLNARLDKCILVKGWKANSTWGFPKGKINQQETERDCAVREVLEETGFDCGPLLPNDSRDYMELTMREQKIRLYIVPGLDEDTYFETQTRKEISKISWFSLSDLPTWKKNKAPPQGMGGKFYLISPFIGKLKQWIHENKNRYAQASYDGDALEEGADSGQHLIADSSGDKSNDLKALLGLSAGNEHDHAPAIDGKGQRMIEEQGDDRGRQLLDLLRGGPAVAAQHTPGQPQLNFGQAESRDDREGGTSSLLAALNAGSGNGNATRQTSGNGSSTALLSLLNGTAGPIHDIPQSSTPLPAPRAQRTAQAQHVLDMISPSTSISFDTQQAAPLVPQQNQSAWRPDQHYQQAQAQISIPNSEDERERERAQKRDMLLSNLMSSSMQIQNPPSQNGSHQDQKVHHQFKFPPQSPGNAAPPQGNLLSLLNGQQASHQPPPHPSTSPFSTFVQQSAGNFPTSPLPQAPPPPSSMMPSSNPLLSLLNKSSDNGHPGFPPQQYANAAPYQNYQNGHGGSQIPSAGPGPSPFASFNASLPPPPPPPYPAQMQPPPPHAAYPSFSPLQQPQMQAPNALQHPPPPPMPYGYPAMQSPYSHAPPQGHIPPPGVYAAHHPPPH
ncbi:DCP2-domain-containing protein [Meira miltonrushii]|uniref:DCP2-domain-containing protein n=1 Tax=Meira miltonrushii TaxID=1280837 RepID=A0A316VF71_9BASI|nr:DCP2-domain-containing protein [Meira miltonrushii]PWN36279.1 DCP2-domain-containing protein [Meira miltonrushii]